MKLARLFSTSTRKAGHTPRLPPPTRDVAAEVRDRVRTTLQASLPARTWPEFEFSRATPSPRRAKDATAAHCCARRETAETPPRHHKNNTGRGSRSQVAGAPLEGRRTALLGPGRRRHARHAAGRGAVPGRDGPEVVRDFGLVRDDGRPLAHLRRLGSRASGDHGS